MITLPRTVYNKSDKTWRGIRTMVPLFNPDCSLGRVLFNLLKLHKKSVAQVSDTENTIVTYEELLGATRIAINLKKMGLKQDDIIGIVAGHTTLAVHVLLGCWFNCNPFHTINPGHEQAVVKHLFAITRPKLFICEGSQYEKVRQVCKDLRLDGPIYTINDHVEGMLQLEDLMQPVPMEMLYRPEELIRGRDQTTCILNSSGITGLPKAVCISNCALLEMEFKYTETSDITFCFSSLDWLSAIHFVIITIMSGAKRVITTRKYTPEYFIGLVEEYKITNIMISPSYTASLVNVIGIENRDMSSCRQFTCVGSTMSKNVYHKLRRLLLDPQKHSIVNNYGITELGGSIAASINTKKAGSVGQLMPGTTIKIVDDNGNQLDEGQTGEILICNEYKWNGYYGNPVETLKIYDVNRWFHSGDLGYFDKDGDLFIVDRKKDIMKYCSVQYAPQEIEEVIMKLPDVTEVCVFGNTNETEGDRAAAAVVRRPGSNLTEQQVVQHVAGQFEVAWKRLTGGVFFMETLPRTANGKVLRGKVKRLALSKEA